MLLELAQYLEIHIHAFNVFTYITLRVVLAALTALAISFIVGPAMIRKLTAYKIGQSVRDDGPRSHLVKSGTPTMGGALILVSIVITTLLWADLSNRYVWICLLTMIGFGAVGWVDDWRKVVHRNPKGLSARAKFSWQSVIAIVAVAFLAFSARLPQQTELIVPFFKTIAIPLGTTGSFTLSCSLQQSGISNYELGVYDVLGQKVYIQPIINQQSSLINLPQLSNGVYFYQLTNGKETYRGKFVKE